MATLRIPRGSSPVLLGTIFSGKANESPVMDLTDLSLAVVESNLGIVTPEIEVTDPVAGKYQLSFPDTTPLIPSRSYQFRIRVGAAGDPGTFTTPFIEVRTS